MPIIVLNAFEHRAGAAAQQEWNKSYWNIQYAVNIWDEIPVKLVKGGDLGKIEGLVSIQRRPPNSSDVHFVGDLIYEEARSPDAEIPGSPESYTVKLFVDNEVFDNTLRLCALGHLPSLKLDFPDNYILGEKKEYGLAFSKEEINPSLAWDNMKFPSLGIVSASFNFQFSSTEEKIDGDREDDVAAQLALPATRAQLALLIKTVKYVGIGLGILAIILHYLH